jgi:hypothetical protein
MDTKLEGTISYATNAKNEFHILGILSDIQGVINVSKIKYLGITH